MNTPVSNADFDLLAPGFRFQPVDEELVEFYLKRKIADEPLPPSHIREVKSFQLVNPATISDDNQAYGMNTWYYFAPKFRSGESRRRSAGDGYWKASGSDRHVVFNNVTVGCKKSFVFYQGLCPVGNRTNWIMHQYSLLNHDAIDDDWVLCKMYNTKHESFVPTSQAKDKDSIGVKQQSDDKSNGKYDGDHEDDVHATIDGESWGVQSIMKIVINLATCGVLGCFGFGKISDTPK